MAEAAGLIYKILSAADWEAAQRAGASTGRPTTGGTGSFTSPTPGR